VEEEQQHESPGTDMCDIHVVPLGSTKEDERSMDKLADAACDGGEGEGEQ